MAAPAYGTEAHVTGSLTNSATVTKPTSTAENDGLVAFIIIETTENPVTGLTAPSGWTQALDYYPASQVSGEEGHVLCYVKLAGGSEPANYTWSWTNNRWREAIIIRVTGVNTAGGNAGIYDIVSGAHANSTSLNWSDTTTKDETLLLFGLRAWAGGAYTGPGTEIYDGTSANEQAAYWNTGPATAGATGTKSFTAAAGAGEIQVVGIALRPPAAGGTTVTPGVASLSLSTFAPKANLQINGASPTALATSAFAPQANLRINGASPTALALSAFAPVLDTKINGASPTALSLSTFAPTAALGPLTCTPGVPALALSTFAPTVSTSGNQTATPGVLALALATFAPQLQLTLTPALVALTLATFAPSLGLTVPVGLVTLALSTFAPPLDFRVTPGAAALVTATFAPAIATPQTVAPGVAALVITRYVPVITNSGIVLTPVSIPMTGSLTVIAMTGSGLAVLSGSSGLSPLSGSVGD